MAKLISEKDAAEIKNFFTDKMSEPVTLRLFVQDPNQPGDCDYCPDTEQLVREVAELNDKVNVVVNLSPTNRELVEQYNVERVPALILERADGTDSGVRFYGIPSGYEFTTLLEDIADLSSGKTKLSPELVRQVEKVQQDVTIKVFVTPT